MSAAKGYSVVINTACAHMLAKECIGVIVAIKVFLWSVSQCP